MVGRRARRGHRIFATMRGAPQVGRIVAKARLKRRLEEG